MEQTNNLQSILTIAYDNDKNQYTFNIPQGMSLQEVAFAIAALIKCLVRESVIKDNQVFVDFINKYLTDPQYSEVKPDEPNN